MDTTETSNRDHPDKRRQVTEVEIDQIKKSLEGLHYGALHIIVQDGVIVQIDRTEKRRLRRPDRTATNAADTKR